MNILVIGSSGHFGGALASYLESNGNNVTGIDRGDRIPDPLDSFDACFLAIPIREAMDFIENHSHPVLIEVCSVKAPMKQYSHRIVSLHPMFGPKSIGAPEFQNIIFIHDISVPNSSSSVEALFPGFHILHMSANEHDRLMVDLLVRPYVLSMLASGTIAQEKPPVSCTSHARMLELAQVSTGESRQAMEDTIRLNPFARDAVRQMNHDLGNIFSRLFSSP